MASLMTQCRLLANQEHEGGKRRKERNHLPISLPLFSSIEKWKVFHDKKRGLRGRLGKKYEKKREANEEILVEELREWGIKQEAYSIEREREWGRERKADYFSFLQNKEHRRDSLRPVIERERKEIYIFKCGGFALLALSAIKLTPLDGERWERKWGLQCQKGEEAEREGGQVGNRHRPHI